MDDFTSTIYRLIESVIDYSSQHKNRHQNHTFTDIDKTYSRKTQNFVPEYAKKKNNLKSILNNIQKYGTPKVFFPNQAHILLGKYNIDVEELKKGIPKQLSNMNLQIHIDPTTGNYIVSRI